MRDRFNQDQNYQYAMIPYKPKTNNNIEENWNIDKFLDFMIGGVVVKYIKKVEGPETDLNNVNIYKRLKKDIMEDSSNNSSSTKYNSFNSSSTKYNSVPSSSSNNTSAKGGSSSTNEYQPNSNSKKNEIKVMKESINELLKYSKKNEETIDRLLRVIEGMQSDAKNTTPTEEKKLPNEKQAGFVKRILIGLFNFKSIIMSLISLAVQTGLFMCWLEGVMPIASALVLGLFWSFQHCMEFNYNISMLGAFIPIILPAGIKSWMCVIGVYFIWSVLTDTDSGNYVYEMLVPFLGEHISKIPQVILNLLSSFKTVINYYIGYGFAFLMDFLPFTPTITWDPNGIDYIINWTEWAPYIFVSEFRRLAISIKGPLDILLEKMSDLSELIKTLFSGGEGAAEAAREAAASAAEWTNEKVEYAAEGIGWAWNGAKGLIEMGGDYAQHKYDAIAGNEDTPLIGGGKPTLREQIINNDIFILLLNIVNIQSGLKSRIHNIKQLNHLGGGKKKKKKRTKTKTVRYNISGLNSSKKLNDILLRYQKSGNYKEYFDSITRFMKDIKKLPKEEALDVALLLLDNLNNFFLLFVKNKQSPKLSQFLFLLGTIEYSKNISKEYRKLYSKIQRENEVIDPLSIHKIIQTGHLKNFNYVVKSSKNELKGLSSQIKTVNGILSNKRTYIEKQTGSNLTKVLPEALDFVLPFYFMNHTHNKSALPLEKPTKISSRVCKKTRKKQNCMSLTRCLAPSLLGGSRTRTKRK